MAFQTHLVAVSWQDGKYAVESQITAAVETDRLKADGYLQDVSTGDSYVDDAAIIAKDKLPDYFLPDSNPWSGAARQWHAQLGAPVAFILVHRVEWESGLED